MHKLLNGIIDFRQNVRPYQKKMFANLAYTQTPTTLIIACSDSRVAPNVFASTDPGDVFMVRNVGNFVPSLKKDLSTHQPGQSVWAAIEFSLVNLHVQDIIVCGHSECGAIHAIQQEIPQEAPYFLKTWLENGIETLTESCICNPDRIRPVHDLVSQKNAILQTEHLKTHSLVRDRVQQGMLHLHAWWFDIADANVMAFDEEKKEFRLIDESYVYDFLRKRQRSAEISTIK
jgi:carbonic anhydrase